ncbi:hypothetical protein BS47DRAFT_1388612 [Hydnum rufescens UP504]|uniref:Uncharacterized protein n=1 Tax=Hydnum rufescens UP504 TaxID=1448309 RepID=A0A9P6B7Y9_9AGAM|nr:hypothetical protein BS47DRAFT_1388612 [Hydnum rufescens UP504]
MSTSEALKALNVNSKGDPLGGLLVFLVFGSFDGDIAKANENRDASHPTEYFMNVGGHDSILGGEFQVVDHHESTRECPFHRPPHWICSGSTGEDAGVNPLETYYPTYEVFTAADSIVVVRHSSEIEQSKILLKICCPSCQDILAGEGDQGYRVFRLPSIGWPDGTPKAVRTRPGQPMDSIPNAVIALSSPLLTFPPSGAPTDLCNLVFPGHDLG